MEHNQKLKSIVEQLGEFSKSEIEDLLDTTSLSHSIPPTTSARNNDNETSDEKCMQFNRETFAWQFADSQLKDSHRDFNFQRYEDGSEHSLHATVPFTQERTNKDTTDSDSIIIKTQEIELIVLNDTEPSKTFEEAVQEAINDTSAVTAKVPNAVKSDISLQFNKPHNSWDVTLENDLKKVQKKDFELSLLDLVGEQKTDLPPVCISRNDPRNIQRMCKTQHELQAFRDPEKKFEAKLHFSCPLAQIQRQIAENDVTDNKVYSKYDDPLNYLTLNYSQTTTNTSSHTLPPSPIVASYNSEPNCIKSTPELLMPTEDNAKHASLRPSHYIPHTMQNPPGQLGNGCFIEGSHLEFLMENSSLADASMVPLSVKQLYDIIKKKYSDFAFVYALSAQLCQSRIPMDCFVHLKIALLLSLASISTNPDRPPIPIIAFGSDICMINYLMGEIGQLGARFIGPTDDIKPPSSVGFRNQNWIEADPIQLAKGGVFYVGDWSRLKIARADELFKNIECSCVSIKKPTQSFPLESAIWAYWCSFKYNAKDQQTFNKFVKIFGIPVYAVDLNQDVLVDFVLQQHSQCYFESTTDHLTINNDDMRIFLSVVSQRSVDLTTEASELLQRYFVASRIARPNCFTKQAFVMLKQFSESFAKLSFRHEVLQIDALSAIYLCENFLQNVFGSSENQPPTAFKSHTFIAGVDEELAQFYDWLTKYIKKYYNSN